jgi:hypothetical protein
MVKHAKISLSTGEFAFWPLLQKIEFETSRDYEAGREAVRAERIYRQQHGITHFDPHAWLEDGVVAIRRGWNVTTFTATIPETPTWFVHPASRTLVLYPEWPSTPYLEIDPPAERLQRIKELSIPPTEADRLAQLDYLLDLSNLSAGKRLSLPLAIPENMTHEEILRSVAASLKILCPRQGKRYRKSPGRGSEQAAIIDDLNALAAYRLCKVARLPRAQVIALIKHPESGALVYGQEKKLDKPLRRIPERIQEFWVETMSHLIPLEPLGLGQPNFDLL